MSCWNDGRGEFYYKVIGGVITVYLCNPDKIGREAEHIMTISMSYLPSLIATMRIAEDGND